MDKPNNSLFVPQKCIKKENIVRFKQLFYFMLFHRKNKKGM